MVEWKRTIEDYDVTEGCEPGDDLGYAIHVIRKGGGDLLSWTSGQRALLAARHANTTPGGKRRAKGTLFYFDKDAQHFLASAAGVSLRQMRYALQLLRTDGAEPLVEAVGRGLISIADALHVVDVIKPTGWKPVVEIVELGEHRTAREAIRWALDGALDGAPD